MIDIWLAYDWYTIGIWLVYDWYMIGTWLVYEWYMSTILIWFQELKYIPIFRTNDGDLTATLLQLIDKVGVSQNGIHFGWFMMLLYLEITWYEDTIQYKDIHYHVYIYTSWTVWAIMVCERRKNHYVKIRFDVCPFPKTRSMQSRQPAPRYGLVTKGELWKLTQLIYGPK